MTITMEPGTMELVEVEEETSPEGDNHLICGKCNPRLAMAFLFGRTAMGHEVFTAVCGLKTKIGVQDPPPALHTVCEAYIAIGFCPNGHPVGVVSE